MDHSYYRLWVHATFATKNRKPLIVPSVEDKIHRQLSEQLTGLGCPVRIVNGAPDHVHLQFLQNPKMALSNTMKQVKGATSHWINQQEFLSDKFAWQRGYGAFSVSESLSGRVAEYIHRQKERHRKSTFEEEFLILLEKHGLLEKKEDHKRLNGQDA